MAGAYLIGVDGGTQSSKVVVYDLDGNVVSQGRRALRPFSRPEPGIVEHPDDDCWQSIAAASREAMASFPGDRADILGVGLCTIRCCKAFLKADGTLLQPLMSWMDIRAYQPYMPDDPELACATTSSGYMTHRFTGEFRDSAANNILLQWPIDTDTWQWDPSLFARFNVTRDLLVELQLPGDVAGHVTAECAAATGIPEGLPVVTTANDKAVEALGTGSLGERTALISLGTYIASMVHGHENRTAPVEFWTNFACIPHRYLYESHGIRRGMWTLSWFLDLLGPEVAAAAAAEGLSREQYLEREAAQVPAGSDGLMSVLDWLAPTDHPFRKGVMLGWDARHTRAHAYRSILEAIALTMKTCVDNMCRELGIVLDDIVVSGGGASSPLFMRIFADVFGLPAARTVGASGASLGSAVCAAVATGVYPDFATAAAAMAGARETFAPDPANTAVYARMLDEVYTRIRAATDPILERSFPIFH
ncbi:MAG TPA: FGGY-family carbohydrate kinase [Thermoleophilia bacterium]|nr:FGGY-family carbohydrate kinase [Thermoleophilia bacterium]